MILRFTTLLLALGMGASLQAATDEGPGFSIHNKTKNMIYVDVCNGNAFKIMGCKAMNFVKIEGKGARPDYRLDIPINIKNATFVRIYNASGQVLCDTEYNPGQTIYINYDGKKLYPQKGALGGILGKITGDPKTGGILEGGPSYSLKNNTTKEFICK